MGKSSYSKRERRSKASSSARTRKSDGSKSWRKKSKKLSRRCRRHDSDSRSSDEVEDWSLSQSSDSYSSSERDYRSSRQARFFSRKDGHKSKKRVRIDYHSFSYEEGSPPLKRRKESKRKGGGSRSMRKSGRSRYVRGASSDYSSCSTCENQSSRENGCENPRGRSERRDSRAKMRDKRNKDRWRGCSSCHRCSRDSCEQDSMFSGDSRSEERMMNDNNSKRLRSVIVVINAGERKGEENKEEIVYDKHDYPSSRNNDSNDDESKKDVLGTKGMLDTGKGKELVVSKLHGEPSGSGGNWQDGSQDNSRPSLGTNHEDLEKRALQNLQKLRDFKKAATSHREPTVAAAKEPGLPIENQVDASGAKSSDSFGDVAENNRKGKAVYARPDMAPTGKKSESAHERLLRKTFASIPGRDVLLAVAPALSNTWKTAYTWRREPALTQPPAKQLASPQKPKPLQQNPMGTETIATKIAAKNSQRVSTLNQLHTKNVSSPMVTETTDSASFAENLRNESASIVSPTKELSFPEIPKDFQAKPSVREMPTTASTIMSGKNVNAPDQTSSNDVPQQSSVAADQSTDTKDALVVASSVDVVKEGPQYKQKTMTVTQGGETIQVNYEVYIPKRTPALARRQLKRDS